MIFLYTNLAFIYENRSIRIDVDGFRWTPSRRGRLKRSDVTILNYSKVHKDRRVFDDAAMICSGNWRSEMWIVIVSSLAFIIPRLESSEVREILSNDSKKLSTDRANDGEEIGLIIKIPSTGNYIL